MLEKLVESHLCRRCDMRSANFLIFLVYANFALCAGSNQTVEAQNADLYQRGLEIIKEQGTAAGISYFRKLTKENDDPRSFFYYGWALWKDGYIKESREVVEFQLQKIPPDGVLAGNCHYLLGNIEQQEGRYIEAKNSLEYALEIYVSNDRPVNQFKTLTCIASTLVREKQYLSAHETLARGWLLYQSDERVSAKINLGYYYEIKSRIAFGRGFYETALDYATKSYQKYMDNGDITRATRARSGIAFFKLIIGYVDEGIEETKALDEIIYSSPDFAKLSYYNAVNWVLIYRCSKQDYSTYEKDILDYIERTNDRDLRVHLDFVLEYNCEE